MDTIVVPENPAASETTRDEKAPTPFEHSVPIPHQPPLLAERLRHHNIATVWVITALAGAGSITLLRGADVARLITPCLMMLAYWVYALRQESKNSEKVADSVYFLGFLWTLYALIDALIVSRGEDIETDAVFATFGYALVTTGLGMFLRMVVMQFRYALPDQLLDGRDEIARQLEAFNREVLSASEVVAHFREGALRQSERWLQEWTQQSQRMRDAVEKSTLEALHGIRTGSQAIDQELQSIAASTKQTAAGMADVSRSTAGLGRRLARNAERWSEELDQNISRTTQAMSSWSEKVRAVDVPPEMFQRHADAILQPIQRNAQALEKTLGATAVASEQVRREMELAPDAWQQMVTHIEATNRQLAQLEDSLKRSREGAQSFFSWWRTAR
jgi:hypothetical protein